jgi:hypothetical protein
MSRTVIVINLSLSLYFTYPSFGPKEVSRIAMQVIITILGLVNVAEADDDFTRSNIYTLHKETESITVTKYIQNVRVRC